MLSIARVESGRGEHQEPWPWTINSEGRGHWFETREDAINYAAAQLDQGSVNFDIGCFQINLQWHPDAFATLDAAFDPTTNAAYAAEYLSSLFAEAGDWKAAVAAYHSRTAELGQTYVARVEAVYARQIQVAATDLAETAPEPEPTPNRFPLLQPGESSGFGSLVPRQPELTALIEEAP